MQVTQSLDFFIYCRSKNGESEVLKRQGYHPSLRFIPWSRGDWREFLLYVTQTCTAEFCVVATEDIILPLHFTKRVEEVVKSAEHYWGSHWALIAAGGLEVPSRQPLMYIKDSGIRTLPAGDVVPAPVSHAAGNLMVLHLSRLRGLAIAQAEAEQAWKLPFGYDFVLSMECYLNNLVCLADSRLFCVDRANRFIPEVIPYKLVVAYWRKKFSGTDIPFFWGRIDSSLYPDPVSPSHHVVSGEHLVHTVIQASYQMRPSLTVVVRTTLQRLNMMRRLLQSLEKWASAAKERGHHVEVLVVKNNYTPESDELFAKLAGEFQLEVRSVQFTPSTTRPPRVEALLEGISKVTTDYIWFVDDDDYVKPEGALLSLSFLTGDNVVVGSTKVYQERWRDNASHPEKSLLSQIRESKNYPHCIALSDNFLPLSAVIYPLHLARRAVEGFQTVGDYYEDYALFLHVNRFAPSITALPYFIAGISVREDGTNTVNAKDRTHWEISYATFVSEAIQTRLISRIEYEAIVRNINTHPPMVGTYDRLVVRLQQIDAFVKRFPRLRSFVVRCIRRVWRI